MEGNNKFDPGMPKEDALFFTYAANELEKNREWYKSTYPQAKYSIFFAETYRSMQSWFSEFIKYYGKWNDQIWHKWVKKFISSIKSNSRDSVKKQKNLDIYYQARENDLDPDRISIVNGKLQGKNWYLKWDRIKDEIGQVIHWSEIINLDLNNINAQEISKILDDPNADKIRLGWPHHIWDIMKGIGKNIKNKSKKRENNSDYIQTELEFDYETQKVIVDWPLWYDRRKKSPEDPDMIFDYDI